MRSKLRLSWEGFMERFDWVEKADMRLAAPTPPRLNHSHVAFDEEFSGLSALFGAPVGR